MEAKSSKPTACSPANVGMTHQDDTRRETANQHNAIKVMIAGIMMINIIDVNIPAGPLNTIPGNLTVDKTLPRKHMSWNWNHRNVW